MSFCLIPEKADLFINALRDGRIDPGKLAGMSSEERNKFLGDFVGVENAQAVNALFESKLLLKNQQRGMITWAKQISGITEPARRDILAKIERMQEVLDPGEEAQFLKDLTATRLGINVTRAEAKDIADLSKHLTTLEEKLDPETYTFPTKDDALDYGMTKVNLENYINDLKLDANKVKFTKNPIQKTGRVITGVPGFLISSLASLDDSLFGRQAIKALLDVRTSHIWARNFAKSFLDIGRQLKASGKVYKAGDDSVMDGIKAQVYSDPNSINGKYKAGGYGLDVLGEEAYPSSLPEKIPLFGRLFKASESAYNGGALRMRQELANRYIKKAEEHGVNTLDKEQAKGLGRLIGGMTGRGNLGKGEALAKEINVLLFSARFLKANFDTLTLHRLGYAVEKGPARDFVRKESAKQLASIVFTVGSILTVAKHLDPDSVDDDPRSSHFGKIKIAGHWTDITGGMGSIATLAGRLVPTQHNGQWGLWSKNNQGVYTNLTSGDAFGQTALDTFNNFWEGKLAPAPGIIRDIWSGKNYQGQKPTVANESKQATTPIILQTYNQLKDSSNSEKLAAMIADGFGFSVSTNASSSVSPWKTSQSKELASFKQKVGEDKFNKAADDYNKRLTDWQNAIAKNSTYKKMTDEQKTSLATTKKRDLQKQIEEEHNFKYKVKRTKKSQSEKDLLK